MAEAPTKTCPISGTTMKPVFMGRILCKYQIQYYYCEECGLLQTEEPYWLEEAYRSDTPNIDTGMISRNLTNQRRLEMILYRLFRCKGQFLDLGGGSGLLTRLLRDIGIDCYTSDKYSQNTMACGFDPPDGLRATGLFAFEVFEHIVDPLTFVKEAFEQYQCKTIVFSTLTFKDAIPPVDWWYYVLEAGQHVSFYQARTLAFLANNLGCRYLQISKDFHLMTDQSLSHWDRACLTNRHLYKFLGRHIRRKRKKLSFTQQDHVHLKKKLNQNTSLRSQL